MKSNMPVNSAFPFWRMSKNNTSASKLTRPNAPMVEVGSCPNTLRRRHPMVPMAARQAPLHKSRILTHLHLVLAHLLLLPRVLLLRLVEPPTTQPSMHSTTALKLLVPAVQVVKPIHMPRMVDIKTTLRTTNIICSSNSKHRQAQRLQHQVATTSLPHRPRAMARMGVVTTLCRHRRECETESISLNMPYDNSIMFYCRSVRNVCSSQALNRNGNVD